MIKVLFLVFSILFTSCSGLVARIHRSLDKQEKRQTSQRLQNNSDPYSIYRQNSLLRGKDARPINNPVTYTHPVTGEVRNLPPNNQRSYSPVRARYTSNDLVDNGNSSSLWSGTGKENFLFSNSDRKVVGDIIILKVEKDLKEEISNELKRAFPVVEAPKLNKDDKQDSNQPPQQPPAAAPNAEPDSDDKVYDKVSTQVVEEISDDYLLLKGRKEVIFRQNKRYLEIQALISRRDVYDGDKVLSNKILEHKIFVLR